MRVTYARAVRVTRHLHRCCGGYLCATFAARERHVPRVSSCMTRGGPTSAIPIATTCVVVANDATKLRCCVRPWSRPLVRSSLWPTVSAATITLVTAGKKCVPKRLAPLPTRGAPIRAVSVSRTWSQTIRPIAYRYTHCTLCVAKPLAPRRVSPTPNWCAASVRFGRRARS